MWTGEGEEVTWALLGHSGHWHQLTSWAVVTKRRLDALPSSVLLKASPGCPGLKGKVW